MWRTALWLALLSASGSAYAQDAETNHHDWVEIGDALAEAGDRASLERAVGAYAHGLERPSDPAYVVALSRTAWALFFLDRVPEAIARFAELVDRVGPSSPQAALRAEAIDLLGAMFADLDWDRDGARDAATTLARLTDTSLVAQDRPWLPELYFETAHALYLTTRDPEAIALLDHALSIWPEPATGTQIEAACRRHRARQAVFEEARGTLPETDAVCARRASVSP